MRIAPRHRSVLIGVIVFSLAVVGLYCMSEGYRHRDYRPVFKSRKGQLISTKETGLGRRAADSLVSFELENDNGITVDGYLSIPSSAAGSHPALIILGGLKTGKRALDYIENTDGLVLLALDYPYRGKTRKVSWREFLTGFPRMQRAIVNTVPAVMLCVDYLEGRGDIERGKIFLVGGSLGALFGPAVAATEPRISGVALLFGAGDLQSLLRANVRLPEPVAGLVSWVAAILVSPVEPLKYVDRISPRPLFMLNGSDDARIPPRCVRLLYDRAGPPKTIVWIPAEHLHVKSKEFHQRTRHELEAWLTRNGMLQAPPPLQ